VDSLLLALAVAVAACVAATTGLGGGVIYVPLMLALGRSYREAAQVSLFLALATGVSASAGFAREGQVDWKLVAVLAPLALGAALLSGALASGLPEMPLRLCLAAVVLGGAVAILRRRGGARCAGESAVRCGESPDSFLERLTWHHNVDGSRLRIVLPLVLPLMAGLGAISGALGIAGGSMNVTVLMACCQVPAQRAVATSAVMNLLACLGGFVGSRAAGAVPLQALLLPAAGALLGAQAGTRLALRLPRARLRALVAVALLLIGAWTAYSALTR